MSLKELQLIFSDHKYHILWTVNQSLLMKLFTTTTIIQYCTGQIGEVLKM